MNTSEIFFVIVKDDRDGSWRPCFLCGLHAERNRAELKMRELHPNSKEVQSVSMKEFEEFYKSK